MAYNCLVKKLKSVVNNDNLFYFNAIRVKVKDNGSTLQNFNVTNSEVTEYIIKNEAFSFANLDGTTKNKYSAIIPANRQLYNEGYEIPANAVGEIIVKNIYNITAISCSRGNFEIEAEDFERLSSLTGFAGIDFFKIKGDITHGLATKNMTVFRSYENPLLTGTFKEVQHPESYQRIHIFNTGMSGDITDFCGCTALTQLWLSYDNFNGTVEDFVAGLVASGKTTGTINLAVDKTHVTYQGRLTDKGADLIWNGASNITYNAFNS